MFSQISSTELERLLLAKEDIEIVDVRERAEFDLIRIPGTKLIPKGEFMDRLDAVDFSKPVYLVCRTGGRSGIACGWLESIGKRATNVSGGVKELWQNGSSVLETTQAFTPAYFS